jgi:hypothetical protein
MNKKELIIQHSNICGKISGLISTNIKKVSNSFNPKNIVNKKANKFIVNILAEYGYDDSINILVSYTNYLAAALQATSSAAATLSSVYKDQNCNNNLDSLLALTRVVNEACIKVHYVTGVDVKSAARFIIASDIEQWRKYYNSLIENGDKLSAIKLYEKIAKGRFNLMKKLELPTDTDISTLSKSSKDLLSKITSINIIKLSEKAQKNIDFSYKELGFKGYTSKTLYRHYTDGNKYIHLTSIAANMNSKNKHFWVTQMMIPSIFITFNLAVKFIPLKKSRSIVKKINELSTSYTSLYPLIMKHWK